MPYLITTYGTQNPIRTGIMHTAAVEGRPFGPSFSLEQAQQADRMEVWGSSFKEIGPDYNEFKLFKGEEIIESKRVMGH